MSIFNSFKRGVANYGVELKSDALNFAKDQGRKISSIVENTLSGGEGYYNDTNEFDISRLLARVYSEIKLPKTNLVKMLKLLHSILKPVITELKLNNNMPDIDSITEENVINRLAGYINAINTIVSYKPENLKIKKTIENIAQNIKTAINDEGLLSITETDTNKILLQSIQGLSLIIPEIKTAFIDKMKDIEILIKNQKIVEKATDKYLEDIINKYMPEEEKETTKAILLLKNNLINKYTKTLVEIIGNHKNLLENADDFDQSYVNVVKDLSTEYDINTNSILDILKMTKDTAITARIISKFLQEINMSYKEYKESSEYKDFKEKVSTKFIKLQSEGKLTGQDIVKLNNFMDFFVEPTFTDDIKKEIDIQIGGARFIDFDDVIDVIDKKDQTSSKFVIKMIEKSLITKHNSLLKNIEILISDSLNNSAFDISIMDSDKQFNAISNALISMPDISRIKNICYAILNYTTNTDSITLAKGYLFALEQIKVACIELKDFAKNKDNLDKVIKNIEDIKDTIKEGTNIIKKEYPIKNLNQNKLINVYKKVVSGGAASGDNKTNNDKPFVNIEDKTKIKNINTSNSEDYVKLDIIKQSNEFSAPTSERFAIGRDSLVDADIVSPQDLANILMARIEQKKSLLSNSNSFTKNANDNAFKTNIELSGRAIANTITEMTSYINKSNEGINKVMNEPIFAANNELAEIHKKQCECIIKYNNMLLDSAKKAIWSCEKLNLMLGEININSFKLDEQLLTASSKDVLKMYTTANILYSNKFYNNLNRLIYNLPVTIDDAASIKNLDNYNTVSNSKHPRYNTVMNSDVETVYAEMLDDIEVLSEYKECFIRLIMMKSGFDIKGKTTVVAEQDRLNKLISNPYINNLDGMISGVLPPYINKLMFPDKVIKIVSNFDKIRDEFIPILDVYSNMILSINKLLNKNINKSIADEFQKNIHDFMVLFSFYKSYNIFNICYGKNDSNTLKADTTLSLKLHDIYSETGYYISLVPKKIRDLEYYDCKLTYIDYASLTNNTNVCITNKYIVNNVYSTIFNISSQYTSKPYCYYDNINIPPVDDITDCIDMSLMSRFGDMYNNYRQYNNIKQKINNARINFINNFSENKYKFMLRKHALDDIFLLELNNIPVNIYIAANDNLKTIRLDVVNIDNDKLYSLDENCEFRIPYRIGSTRTRNNVNYNDNGINNSPYIINYNNFKRNLLNENIFQYRLSNLVFKIAGSNENLQLDTLYNYNNEISPHAARYNLINIANLYIVDVNITARYSKFSHIFRNDIDSCGNIVINRFNTNIFDKILDLSNNIIINSSNIVDNTAAIDVVKTNLYPNAYRIGYLNAGLFYSMNDRFNGAYKANVNNMLDFETTKYEFSNSCVMIPLTKDIIYELAPSRELWSRYKNMTIINNGLKMFNIDEILDKDSDLPGSPFYGVGVFRNVANICIHSLTAIAGVYVANFILPLWNKVGNIGDADIDDINIIKNAKVMVGGAGAAKAKEKEEKNKEEKNKEERKPLFTDEEYKALTEYKYPTDLESLNPRDFTPLMKDGLAAVGWARYFKKLMKYKLNENKDKNKIKGGKANNDCSSRVYTISGGAINDEDINDENIEFVDENISFYHDMLILFNYYYQMIGEYDISDDNTVLPPYNAYSKTNPDYKPSNIAQPPEYNSSQFPVKNSRLIIPHIENEFKGLITLLLEVYLNNINNKKANIANDDLIQMTNNEKLFFINEINSIIKKLGKNTIIYTRFKDTISESFIDITSNDNINMDLIKTYINKRNEFITSVDSDDISLRERYIDPNLISNLPQSRLASRKYTKEEFKFSTDSESKKFTDMLRNAKLDKRDMRILENFKETINFSDLNDISKKIEGYYKLKKSNEIKIKKKTNINDKIEIIFNSLNTEDFNDIFTDQLMFVHENIYTTLTSAIFYLNSVVKVVSTFSSSSVKYLAYILTNIYGRSIPEDPNMLFTLDTSQLSNLIHSISSFKDIESNYFNKQNNFYPAVFSEEIQVPDIIDINTPLRLRLDEEEYKTYNIYRPSTRRISRFNEFSNRLERYTAPIIKENFNSFYIKRDILNLINPNNATIKARYNLFNDTEKNIYNILNSPFNLIKLPIISSELNYQEILDFNGLDKFHYILNESTDCHDLSQDFIKHLINKSNVKDFLITNADGSNDGDRVDNNLKNIVKECKNEGSFLYNYLKIIMDPFNCYSRICDMLAIYGNIVADNEFGVKDSKDGIIDVFISRDTKAVKISFNTIRKILQNHLDMLTNLKVIANSFLDNNFLAAIYSNKLTGSNNTYDNAKISDIVEVLNTLLSDVNNVNAITEAEKFANKTINESINNLTNCKKIKLIEKENSINLVRAINERKDNIIIDRNIEIVNTDRDYNNTISVKNKDYISSKQIFVKYYSENIESVTKSNENINIFNKLYTYLMTNMTSSQHSGIFIRRLNTTNSVDRFRVFDTSAAIKFGEFYDLRRTALLNTYNPTYGDNNLYTKSAIDYKSYNDNKFKNATCGYFFEFNKILADVIKSASRNDAAYMTVFTGVLNKLKNIFVDNVRYTQLFPDFVTPLLHLNKIDNIDNNLPKNYEDYLEKFKNKSDIDDNNKANKLIKLQIEADNIKKNISDNKLILIKLQNSSNDSNLINKYPTVFGYLILYYYNKCLKNVFNELDINIVNIKDKLQNNQLNNIYTYYDNTVNFIHSLNVRFYNNIDFTDMINKLNSIINSENNNFKYSSLVIFYNMLMFISILADNFEKVIQSVINYPNSVQYYRDLLIEILNIVLNIDINQNQYTEVNNIIIITINDYYINPFINNIQSYEMDLNNYREYKKYVVDTRNMIDLLRRNLNNPGVDINDINNKITILEGRLLDAYQNHANNVNLPRDDNDYNEKFDLINRYRLVLDLINNVNNTYNNIFNKIDISGNVIKLNKKEIKPNIANIISSDAINYIAKNTKYSSDEVKSIFNSNILGDVTNEKFPESIYYSKEIKQYNQDDDDDMYLLNSENICSLYELTYTINFVKNITNKYINIKEENDDVKTKFNKLTQDIILKIKADEYKLKECSDRIEENLKSILNIRKSNQDLINYTLSLDNVDINNIELAKLVNINNTNINEDEINQLKAIYSYSNEVKEKIDFKETILKMYNYFDAISHTAPSKIDSSGINQFLVDGMCFSTENLRSKVNSSIFETMLRNKNSFNNPFININNFSSYDYYTPKAEHHNMFEIIYPSQYVDYYESILNPANKYSIRTTTHALKFGLVNENTSVLESLYYLIGNMCNAAVNPIIRNETSLENLNERWRNEMLSSFAISHQKLQTINKNLQLISVIFNIQNEKINFSFDPTNTSSLTETAYILRTNLFVGEENNQQKLKYDKMDSNQGRRYIESILNTIKTNVNKLDDILIGFIEESANKEYINKSFEYNVENNNKLLSLAIPTLIDDLIPHSKYVKEYCNPFKKDVLPELYETKCNTNYYLALTTPVLTRKMPTGTDLEKIYKAFSVPSIEDKPYIHANNEMFKLKEYSNITSVSSSSDLELLWKRNVLLGLILYFTNNKKIESFNKAEFINKTLVLYQKYIKNINYIDKNLLNSTVNDILKSFNISYKAKLNYLYSNNTYGTGIMSLPRINLLDDSYSYLINDDRKNDDIYNKNDNHYSLQFKPINSNALMLNNYTPGLFISDVSYYTHLSPMFESEFSDINRLMTAVNTKDKNKNSFVNSSLLNIIFTKKKKEDLLNLDNKKNLLSDNICAVIVRNGLFPPIKPEIGLMLSVPLVSILNRSNTMYNIINNMLYKLSKNLSKNFPQPNKSAKISSTEQLTYDDADINNEVQKVFKDKYGIISKLIKDPLSHINYNEFLYDFQKTITGLYNAETENKFLSTILNKIYPKVWKHIVKYKTDDSNIRNISDYTAIAEQDLFYDNHKYLPSVYSTSEITAKYNENQYNQMSDLEKTRLKIHLKEKDKINKYYLKHRQLVGLGDKKKQIVFSETFYHEAATRQFSLVNTPIFRLWIIASYLPIFIKILITNVFKIEKDIARNPNKNKKNEFLTYVREFENFI